MAFKFKKKESVAKAVRRLCNDCVEEALKGFQERDKLEGVHSARKEIKKLRALMRLVRKEIGEGLYRKRTEALREAAQCLAAPRDAQVKLQTMEALVAHFKGQVSAHSVDKMRQMLKQKCREEAAAFPNKEPARMAKRILRKQLAKFESLPIHGKGWSVIGPGVKQSYSAGRRAYEVARETPSAENFHDWRKRAKDLWYYIQLLEPIWPEQMCAVSRELDELGEFLGDDHDLDMLKLIVGKKSICPEFEKEAELLTGLIDSRQQILRTSALVLGKRFYAEKPSIFCKRLRQYWKTWRSEPAAHKRLLAQNGASEPVKP